MTQRSARVTILLVEDSIEEAHLVRSILEKSGKYQVTSSQDGDHAARLLRDRSFDLVVTDLNLPGIDGYDLIRMAKAGRADLPVLATTGYTASHYIDQAYRAGADHVLIKPLVPEELLERVRSLLEGGKEAAPEQPPSVLAIGALPGDVEGGCGGTLLACRARGDEVLIFPLTTRSSEGIERGEAERRGAERMGARIIVSGASVTHAEDPTEHQLLLERIVRELRPHTVFIPSLADDEPGRREAHRISRTVVPEVPIVLAYETGTSTHDFHPSRFLDVGAFMDAKLDVLTAYREYERPDLAAAYVKAAARHWGHHLDFGQAEAFEVIRDVTTGDE